MSCKIEMCDIPACTPILNVGYIVGVANETVFVSFRDISTGATKWFEGETDGFGLLSVDVSEETEWLSLNKKYEIATHTTAGNSCPDYCINALTVDDGEINASVLIAGFIKTNFEIEEYTLRIK